MIMSRATCCLSELASAHVTGRPPLQVGDVVDGKIMSIQPYGAFVNCGGFNDGLLHVSQISHDRVTNLEAVFSVGDTIKVRTFSTCNHV